MKTIIVTGGLGSGKTTVCSLLRRAGIPVYDCDSAAKSLYVRYPELGAMVVPDIFNRPEDLERLENALFPLLLDDFNAWAEESGREVVAFESATVLQKKFFDNFGDYVLLVEAPEAVRLERAVARGGQRQDMQRRIALQTDQRNNPRVDFILNNDSSVEHAGEQIDEFLKKINYYGN